MALNALKMKADTNYHSLFASDSIVAVVRKSSFDGVRFQP